MRVRCDCSGAASDRAVLSSEMRKRGALSSSKIGKLLYDKLMVERAHGAVNRKALPQCYESVRRMGLPAGQSACTRAADV